ncbi:12028_t:CDS:2, partial [Cetraspora pellucida]
MAREEYSVVVEMDDETPVTREELEFQSEILMLFYTASRTLLKK